MLKTIIVEDEKISRDVLSSYLKKYCPEVTICGAAENIVQGKELILKHQPDLVFLDIEMPMGNAFDLLEQLNDISFETIFVTAYSNYAIKAIQFSAASYLLKPLSVEELIKAVESVRNEKEKKERLQHTRILIENMSKSGKQMQKIVLPLLEGFEVIALSEIIHCKANDNFTEFYLSNGKKMMICRTLKYYEDLLSDHDFIRVHKSHLVNLQHIKKYHKGKGGQLVMNNQEVIDVSVSYKENLLNHFKDFI